MRKTSFFAGAALLLAPAVAAQSIEELASDLYGQVSFLRGLEASTQPKVRQASRADIAKAMQQNAFDLKIDDTVQKMLGILGAIPPRLDARKKAAQVLAKQGRGYFDAKQRTVWINAGNEKFGDFAKRLQVVRSLTNAIDEHYFEVSQLLEDRRHNHDMHFALGAVYEGSAAGMMQQWVVENRKGRKMPELMKVVKFADARNRASYESPRYFSRHMAMALMGLYFLTRGKGAASLLPDIPVGYGRNAQHAYKRPPLSSEQILHPEKYWDRAKLDVPVVLGNEKDFSQRLTKILGAEIVRVDTLGEFQCAILGQTSLQRVRPEQMRKIVTRARHWTVPASQGWGGDRLFLTKRGSDFGIAWFTYWDTDKDAIEFRQAYARYHGKRVGFATKHTGKLNVFAYGFCKQHLDELFTLATKHGDPKKDNQPFLFEPGVFGRPR